MIHDILGRPFDFPRPPQRVVSLVPSLTETLADLGVAASLVAITDFCIFPPELDRLRIGGTKNPRVEVLRSLQPDLVHMNLEENLERDAREIEAFAPVFVTEPKSVVEVTALFATLGAIHHCSKQAASLTQALDQERTSAPRAAFTFACAIWKQPWMWCGGDTYVSSLVEACGGRNVLDSHRRYPKLSLEEVAGLQPGVVFLPDEPFVFTDADAELVRRAAKTRVIGPFPGHLFTWHGSRTILGLRFLRQALS